MKIIKLSAQNIKRLKAVEITPQGNVVTITGPNASGKSSLLDCIYMALAGASAIPSKPVREGEDSAKIVLDLGECTVTRKFTSDGKTSLVVEALSGSRFPSPQKMLDSLLSGLSFDPLAFTRMLPKEQLETLKRLVKLDVDADALDGLNSKDYETRTEVNREIARIKAQVTGLKIPDVPASDMELDESLLLKEMEEAATVNSNIQKARSAKDAAYAEEVRLGNELTRARAEVARLEAAVENAHVKYTLLNTAELREPIDIAQLRFKVERARNASAARRAIQERDRLTLLLKSKVDEAAQLTLQMEERLTLKTASIARAQMPVRGLSFGEGEVLYKGVPFAQASSAEQLLISTAICMNANPKLRVIRIADGSLLDQNSLALIGKLAVKGDYQCWVECVDSKDPMAIHMSDGEVVTIPKREEESIA